MNKCCLFLLASLTLMALPCAATTNIFTVTTNLPAGAGSLSNAIVQANSTSAGDGLNTGGYSFNARSNERRDSIIGKLDYNLSPQHNALVCLPSRTASQAARTAAQQSDSDGLSSCTNRT